MRVNQETGDLKKQMDKAALQAKREREALELSVEELQGKLRATSEALASLQTEKNRVRPFTTACARRC